MRKHLKCARLIFGVNFIPSSADLSNNGELHPLGLYFVFITNSCNEEQSNGDPAWSLWIQYEQGLSWSQVISTGNSSRRIAQ